VARRRPATRRGRQGAPAWIWLLSGILIGLGLAWYLFAKGYIPHAGPEPDGSADANLPGPASSEEVAPATRTDRKSRYDFFTVLPEMEVVVPEQELQKKNQAQKADTPPQADADSYMLQVGSFRDMPDAEQLKARLALLGIVARVQSVKVDDATWHRVRVGPVTGARKADEVRRQLADNGIDSLVLKNP
jgi:cell division protein FtsN